MQAGLGIIFDVALFAAPVVFTWRHLSSGKMRYRVTLLLGCGMLRWTWLVMVSDSPPGLFTCVAGIVRFYYLVVQPPPADLYVSPSLMSVYRLTVAHVQHMYG